MKNINVNITFAITDADTGASKCTGGVDYLGMDYDQLLFVERHLVEAFQFMNKEAAVLSASANASKK